MDIPLPQDIELGNGTLKYRLGGQGPLLVIIHGLAGHSEHYYFQFRELGQRFAILAPDFRGQGVTPRGHGPLSIEAAAKDLEELLDKLGLAGDKFHLLGHSMGGMIAQEFALTHPDRILSLMLICTAARSDLGPFYELLRHVAPPLLSRLPVPQCLPSLVLKAQTALLGRPDSEVMAWVRGLKEDYGPEVMSAMAEYYNSLSGWDFRSRLKEIKVPILAVYGSRDPVMPGRMSRELIQNLPDPSVVRIHPSGHNPQFENHKDFNRAVLDFISGI